MVDWIAIKNLENDETVENKNLLFYIYQKKLCRRITPEVISGYYNGRIYFHGGHYDPENLSLGEITHYAYFEDPWAKD